MPRTYDGTGNLSTMGFASIRNGNLYHMSFEDYKLHKTNLKTDATEVLSDGMVQYIANYKNDIYYLEYKVSDDATSFVYEYKKLVEDGEDVLVMNEELIFPQFSGDYLYFLKVVPEFHSGNSMRIYRAPLSGGETELVCDALTTTYYVDGNDLYYLDVATTSFLKVNLKDTIKYVSENPLAPGGLRSSDEFAPKVILTNAVPRIAVVEGNTLSYIDALNESRLLKCNLKTGEISNFNAGVYAASFNIYGDYIYYHNSNDFSLYRMDKDGNNIIKVSGVSIGYYILSNDRLVTLETDGDYRQFLGVYDLEGNLIKEVDVSASQEEYYEDSAVELPEEEATDETNVEA